MDILNETSDFFGSPNFKLMSQTKENSINNYVSLKFYNFSNGSHYDYSPQAPKNVVTALMT